jgi:hypothetical protein
MVVWSAKILLRTVERGGDFNTLILDGSKLKAVNDRDRNFTSGKMKTRMALIEQSITEYLAQLDWMDRKETPSAPRQVARLKERITTLRQEMRRLGV